MYTFEDFVPGQKRGPILASGRPVLSAFGKVFLSGRSRSFTARQESFYYVAAASRARVSR